MLSLLLRAAPWLARTFLFSRGALAVNGALAADHFILGGKGMETAGAAAGRAASVIAPILGGETAKFLHGLGLPNAGDLTEKAKQFFGMDTASADADREQKLWQKQQAEKRADEEKRGLRLTESFNENAGSSFGKILIVIGALYEMTKGNFSQGWQIIKALMIAEQAHAEESEPIKNSPAPFAFLIPQPAP